MTNTIRLTDINSFGYSILGLYQAVAKKLGFGDPDLTFDCTKIEVSENIFDTMMQSAVDTLKDKATEDCIRTEYSMHWCMSGPKATIIENNTVKVYDGFIEGD